MYFEPPPTPLCFETRRPKIFSSILEIHYSEAFFCNVDLIFHAINCKCIIWRQFSDVKNFSCAIFAILTSSCPKHRFLNKNESKHHIDLSQKEIILFTYRKIACAGGAN